MYAEHEAKIYQILINGEWASTDTFTLNIEGYSPTSYISFTEDEYTIVSNPDLEKYKQSAMFGYEILSFTFEDDVYKIKWYFTRDNDGSRPFRSTVTLSYDEEANEYTLHSSEFVLTTKKTFKSPADVIFD